MVAAITASSDLTTLGTVLTTIWGWFAGFLTTLSSEPILLIGVSFMVASLVIGLVFSAVRGKGAHKR